MSADLLLCGTMQAVSFFPLSLLPKKVDIKIGKRSVKKILTVTSKENRRGKK
jgi:hypothetical protein